MGGSDRRIHPDFGPSFGEIPVPYGIPFNVVDGDHPKVSINFDGPDGGYPEESDPGPYPFDENTRIEGGPDAAGDRHALMIDRDNCVLYELYHADWNGGDPTADQGSVFDLRSNDLRPDGWTSADAAGLPIFAGLIRRDEVAAGEIDHAICVTAQQTDRRYLWPARHQAGVRSDPTLPPMGAWFRLEAGFDISGFRPDTQVVLRAMKKHGLIVADNGSNWFFGGTAEEGWDNDMLDELKTIPAGRFEAVDASSLMVDPDFGRVTDLPPPGCDIAGTNADNNLTGTPASEVICGLAGNDAINGRGGNDTIKDGTGADRLYGASGNDTLNTRDRVRRNDLANGGEGADVCAVDRADRKISCR
jgi:RTX calcium-binding nonapeptide repeat (4 copies)